MYILNKIVGGLISPIGIALAMLTVGGVRCLDHLRCLKRLGRARWWFVAAGVWLWVWSTPLMSWIMGTGLERDWLVEGRVPRVESYPAAEAIVLLGGSMGFNSSVSDSAEMWTSADRVWMAARLWKTGKAPVIIASGGSVEASTGGLLADLGIPREAVIFDETPRNTEEEAKALSKRGYRKVLLVTSAWHTNRAMMMFKMYAPAVEAVAAPADFENTIGTAEFSLSWFFPNAASLMWNGVTFHEWLGIVGYRILR